jgi:hypothetical protein
VHKKQQQQRTFLKDEEEVSRVDNHKLALISFLGSFFVVVVVRNK